MNEQDSHSGFIRAVRGGRWQVDPNKKLGSLISNSIILQELNTFLMQNEAGECLVDVGCGTRPYAPLYRDRFHRMIGFDVATSPHDLSQADFLAFATAIPLSTGCCDCVLCTEVLEHTSEPEKALQEIARILQSNGWLFLSVPLLIGLHEEPHDYYRYTVYGLHHLLAKAGFELIRVQTKGDMVAVFLSMLLWPWCKFWYMLSKLLGFSRVYSAYNPFLWLTVVLTQKLYLKWFNFLQKQPPQHWAKRLYRRLESATLGYVVIARRLENVGV